MLHRVWFSLFAIGFVGALWPLLTAGDASVAAAIVEACFAMAKLSVEIAIGLVGVLALWLGLFRVAEQAGLVAVIGRALAPVFRVLMPGVPAGHPAVGAVTLNLSANMLGLDNAATPLGLKAMRELQSLNPTPERATDAQILFLVLNTSSVTLLPVSIFVYRAQQGAADPALVFLPILLATSASTLAGLLVVAALQKLPVWRLLTLWPVLLGMAVIGALLATLVIVPATTATSLSSAVGNVTLLAIVMLFLGVGLWRGHDIYSSFVEGAEEGFRTAVALIPYLVAMLVAVGVLRASGALDAALELLRMAVAAGGFDTRWVDAMPTALVKPFSGSGARAMMLETMQTEGVDSFAGRLAAIIQGSTETTFYVLAVYFGSVGIRHARYALWCGLFADAAGVAASIAVCYAFFG
ncbi:MAG: nucleoside recognition domain-containing protein [Gammaproteobacteria bacterium]